jgi:tetratricopeptide (TPR) repeat protein
MFIRTVLILVVVVSGLYIYISSLNPLAITFQYYRGTAVGTSLAVLLISAFFAGAFLVALAYLVRDIVRVIRGRRQKKEQDNLLKWFHLATDALYKDNLPKAERHMRAYLAKRENDPVAYLRLADVYQRGGRLSEAIETLQRAKQLNRDQLEVLFAEAQIYKEKGDHEGAIAALEEILAIDASNLEALTTLRDIYTEEHRWEQGLDIQSKIVKSSPADDLDQEKTRYRGIRYEYAQTLVDAGEHERSVRELRDIIKDDPSFVPPQVLLGDVLAQSGDPKEALKVWRKGFDESGHSIFLTRLEDSYLKQEDPRGIIRLYREAMDSAPDNIVIPFFYARLCLRLEMVDEALDRLLEMETNLGEHPMYHFLLAEVYLHRGEYQEAATRYQQGLRLRHDLAIPYRCTACRKEVREWQPLCPNCGQWGTFTVCTEQIITPPATPHLL